MIVVKESDVLTFDVPFEDLHHLDHLFGRIFGANHHVDALQIRLTFEIAAVTEDGCHYDKRSYGGGYRDNCADEPSGSIGADGTHDIYRQKLLAVAAILQVRVPAHHVGKLVRNHRRKLGFVIH